jgi:hypothetical protein
MPASWLRRGRAVRFAACWLLALSVTSGACSSGCPEVPSFRCPDGDKCAAPQGPLVTLSAVRVQSVDTSFETRMTTGLAAMILLARRVDCQSWIAVASSTQIKLGPAGVVGKTSDIEPGQVLRATGWVSYDKQDRGTLFASEVLIAAPVTATPEPAMRPSGY